jgi:glycyl-tRNA synthetase
LKSPFGNKEMEGIHWRSDWDLGRHSEYSGQDLTFEGITPHIVETSGGVDRTFLFLLIDSYTEDGKRVFLKLNPKVAPYKTAVFPLLSNKENLVTKAKNIYEHLRLDLRISSAFDDRGNIGKRYFAQDEIGTPWCVTIDFKTLEDNTVTIRDRDTTKQERISIDKLENFFNNKLKL